MAIDWNNIKNNLNEITETKEDISKKKTMEKKEEKNLEEKQKKPFTKMVFAKSKKNKNT